MLLFYFLSGGNWIGSEGHEGNGESPPQMKGSAHNGETMMEEKHTKECKRECKAYRDMVEKIHTYEKIKGSSESERKPIVISIDASSGIMDEFEDTETCEESCMERKDFEEKQKKWQQQKDELYRLLKPKLVELFHGLEDLVSAKLHRMDQDMKREEAKEKKAGKITFRDILRQLKSASHSLFK